MCRARVLGFAAKIVGWFDVWATSIVQSAIVSFLKSRCSTSSRVAGEAKGLHHDLLAVAVSGSTRTAHRSTTQDPKLARSLALTYNTITISGLVFSCVNSSNPSRA
jgi:hypothetical protein